MPYFTHFTRELNAPSWGPVTPAGSTIDYAALADQATSANRNILNVRVKASFVRADGTTSVVGEPLIKNRFPLRRLDSIGPSGANSSAFPVMVGGVLQAPTATTDSPYVTGTTTQRDFGLIWNTANKRWDYVGAAGSAVQSSIATLDQVATANREPNFFEVLKAFILSGSIGLGSDNTGAARTFVNAELRFYQQPLSKDSQIVQIGANIIDQWDNDKNPTFIFFGSDEFARVENLPYLSKLVFQPQWTTGVGAAFKSWIIPSLWTPTQNATAVGTESTSSPFTIPAVRFIMTSGSVSASVSAGATTANSATITADPAILTTQPYAQLTTSATFGPDPNSPSSATAIKQLMTTAPNLKLGIQLVFAGTPGITKDNTTKAYPIFTNATFEMQARIGGSSGTWKTYQRWVGCQQPATPLACEPAVGFDWTQTNIYDPEFVLLDPRIMRFGVWGAQAGTSSTELTRGLLDTLERASIGFQSITALGPQGTSFTSVGAEMANNTSGSPKYIDLDGLQRSGDSLTTGALSAMLPTDSADRPPLLFSVGRQLRMVSELGTVSRGQPWKTLNFTTPISGMPAY
ncbi:MAG: hypothetical protein ABI217_08565 [Chthoniobacterales bacterium]